MAYIVRYKFVSTDSPVHSFQRYRSVLVVLNVFFLIVRDARIRERKSKPFCFPQTFFTTPIIICSRLLRDRFRRLLSKTRRSPTTVFPTHARSCVTHCKIRNAYLTELYRSVDLTICRNETQNMIWSAYRINSQRLVEIRR